MIKVKEFIQNVRNGVIDTTTLMNLIDEANMSHSLEIEILDTDTFIQNYMTGDPDDMYTFAKIVRFSNLTLNDDYIYTNIYYDKYSESDKFANLLSDDDLEEIYEAWRDNRMTKDTDIKEEELESSVEA